MSRFQSFFDFQNTLGMRRGRRSERKSGGIIYLARQTQARASRAFILEDAKVAGIGEDRGKWQREKRVNTVVSWRLTSDDVPGSFPFSDPGKFSSVLRQQSPILRLSFRPSSRVLSSRTARERKLAPDQTKVDSTASTCHTALYAFTHCLWTVSSSSSSSSSGNCRFAVGGIYIWNPLDPIVWFFWFLSLKGLVGVIVVDSNGFMNRKSLQKGTIENTYYMDSFWSFQDHNQDSVLPIFLWFISSSLFIRNLFLYTLMYLNNWVASWPET